MGVILINLYKAVISVLGVRKSTCPLFSPYLHWVEDNSSLGSANQFCSQLSKLLFTPHFLRTLGGMPDFPCALRAQPLAMERDMLSVFTVTVLFPASAH